MQEEQNTEEQNEIPEKILHLPVTKSFQHRSEAAQEIISRQPGFVEKWALMLFLIILLLLVCSTWFVYYPDIIQAQGSLTADNAPKEIVPWQSGRLIKLFVKNGDEVKKGDMIGWIESTANTEEVISLSGKLDSSFSLLTQGKSENLSKLFEERYNNLGELQAPYQIFTTAFQQYNDYLVNGFYMNKREVLLKEIATLSQMNLAIEEQKILAMEDKDSAKISLSVNKVLLDEKVIAPEDYRAENSKYISKEMSIPQYNSSIFGNQNQQAEMQKEVGQLDHDINQQKIIFEEAMQTLKSSVDDWIHKYTLQAPLDGIVFFAVPLQQNKFIEQGKLLGYINPPNSNFYAEVNLPQNNFGKVDSGMSVQLRFDAYPYQEAGFVKGKLSYVSKIASDSGFYAKVRLDKGLVTNLKNDIPYKNGLRAQAIIITKNMRLLQRIYYSIVKSTSIGK
jgi:multidrug resistance efflux pump